MQSKNIAVAEQLGEDPSEAALTVADRTRCCGAACQAARRLEIDRDNRIVTRGLAREVCRILADEADEHPEILMERMETALAASRADSHRLNNLRINLRGDRGAHFEDSVALPAALDVYGHRGNYHGTHASMKALGVFLSPLVARPEGDDRRVSAVALAEELHRRCEIWTFALSGAVHVFARPGSAADTALAGTATRMSRAPAWPLRTLLTIV